MRPKNNRSKDATSHNDNGPDEMRKRLNEAEETLRAITHGEVDALIVTTDEGEKVYTLQGADRPYRIMVEQMSEGAVTLDPDDHVLYSNQAFADMLRMPLEKVMGRRFGDYVLPLDRSQLSWMKRGANNGPIHGRISLTADDGTLVPVRISISRLWASEIDTYCVILSDISEIARAEEALLRMNDELEVMVRERTATLARTNDLLKAEVIERIISQRQLASEKGKISEILGEIGVAMIVTDETSKVVLMNSPAEILTGWRGREAYGLPLDEVFMPIPLANGPKSDMSERLTSAGDSMVTQRGAIMSRNGSILMVECSGGLLAGEDGRPRAKVITFRKEPPDERPEILN